jgi:signal transduction histidine kinase
VNAKDANGRATDTGLADSLRDSSATESACVVGGELENRRRTLRPWGLRDPEFGAEKRLNNEFMAVFSHELRNYLGAIRGAAYLLYKETSASPTAVKANSVIERQIKQMTRLVEDLLDESRIRNGQLTFKCEPTDLCAIVTHSVQTVAFTMQERDQRLTTSFPDAPVWVRADSARLQQVFVNLLVNAAKYTEVGGHIELSVEREADDVIVRVRDTGIGIAPDVLPHVFDLFVQADRSSRHADVGLGIGLALVRNLVESHDGRISATSAGLKQGSEFTVRLPMHAE